MTAQLQEKAIYAVDRAHTTVEFIVRHLMITKVRGRFTAFDGQIELGTRQRSSDLDYGDH